MIDKAQIHKEICDGMNDTYVRKNHDYGDSFAKMREKFPNAILIRLNDKLGRLESLIGGDAAKVSDESIYDTLLDLANYAVMEMVEMRVDSLRAPEKIPYDRRPTILGSEVINYLDADDGDVLSIRKVSDDAVEVSVYHKGEFSVSDIHEGEFVTPDVSDLPKRKEQ